MQLFSETLDELTRSGEAVFATDGADRIIFWNRECEALLGLPSRQVIGKACHEVIRGRDANGNRYCHRNCAVAHQARETDDPVRRFPLTVRTDEGSVRQVSASMFAVPSYHGALTTLVHVLRAGPPAPEQAGASEPIAPMVGAASETVTLTKREMEILRSLAAGLSTPSTARKLGIAAVTVRNHIQRILQKLGVHSKLEAVVLAHKKRLIA